MNLWSSAWYPNNRPSKYIYYIKILKFGNMWSIKWDIIFYDQIHSKDMVSTPALLTWYYIYNNEKHEVIGQNTLIMIDRTSWSTLQWRHNERDGMSNYQPYDYLLNLLLRCSSKKTSKLHITGDWWIPCIKASKAEKGSIWRFHHEGPENCSFSTQGAVLI